MPHSSDKATDFDFPRMISEWLTYNSSRDKTNIVENVFVRGSQNVYKKLSGTIANRPGQKRLGVANDTFSGISSEFVWNTSFGRTYTLVVADSTLSVVVDGVWYTLLGNLPEERYVFDKWWNDTEKKDRLLFVNGNDYLQSWSGGFTTITSASNDTDVVATLDPTPTVSGSGYSIGDILTITTGGSGATAEVTKLTDSTIGSVGIVNPGLGYTVNDTLTIPGVLFGGVPATVVVTTIGALGVITGIALHTPGGQYPGDNASVGVTGGTGINAQLSYTVTDTGVAEVKILTRGTGYSTGTGKVTTVSPVGGTGATLNITAIADGTLTKNDPIVTWAEAGFTSTAGEMLININNNQYTYTGGADTDTLYGITPDATIEPINSVAIQSVITTPDVPETGFHSDFLKVINNQVYIGSYTSDLTYISSNTDFSDYTVPSPRTPGDPELVTLGGTGKGISVRNGNAWIGFGTDSWATISFNNITVGTDLTQQTIVDIRPVALLQAPLAHEFIDTVGDAIVYLAQDHQLRTVGDFNTLFVTGYPSFSQELAPELMEQDFTGGSLRCIGEFTYINAPIEGKTYLYQVRQSVNANAQVVTERLWHSPFIWSLTHVDEIDGIVYGFSNANPQIYQLWDTFQWHDDSPSDEPLPYTSICALSYRGEQRRQGLWSFDKNFTEFYATLGTTLTLTMNYNYQGARNTLEAIVTSPNQLGYAFTPNQQTIASLGDEPLGDEPLGDVINQAFDDQDQLPKFKVINSLNLISSFEWQPIFWSELADDRWELLATATNATLELEQQATFIINKVRMS